MTSNALLWASRIIADCPLGTGCRCRLGPFECQPEAFHSDRMALATDGHYWPAGYLDKQPSPEVSDPDPGPWWCDCDETQGPHVHCPWGGHHIHRVDITTGRDLPAEDQ